MLKLLGLVTALSVSAAAVAAEELTKEQECFGVSSFAEIFMTAHQKGRSLSTMMETAPDWAKVILIDAYEGPRMSAEKNKKDQIERHRDKWALACFKGEISIPQKDK